MSTRPVLLVQLFVFLSILIALSIYYVHVIASPCLLSTDPRGTVRVIIFLDLLYCAVATDIFMVATCLREMDRTSRWAILISSILAATCILAFQLSTSTISVVGMKYICKLLHVEKCNFTIVEKRLEECPSARIFLLGRVYDVCRCVLGK